jgi:serine/threonine-protein kinase
MATDPDNGSDKTVVRAAGAADEPVRARDDVGIGEFEATRVRVVMSDDDPLIGAKLGEFRVLGPLGSGAIGLVYRGDQPRLGRPVAIKVLKPEFARDPGHTRRFLEEAKSLGAARHPGIIDVISFGEGPNGQPYLVMELLEGEPLDVVLAQQGALLPLEALAVLVPVLGALSAAHAAGVIHRDLKPGNIFMARQQDGSTTPKLLDFGLARRGAVGELQQQTTVGGTPLYIAPEQARGEAIGPSADLYSIGCIAWELLVGRPPFTAGNLLQLLDLHLTVPPPPLRAHVPEVPLELERLVLNLMEKDAQRRPSSAEGVRDALVGIERALRDSVAPTSPERRKVRRPTRPPVNTLPDAVVAATTVLPEWGGEQELATTVTPAFRPPGASPPPSRRGPAETIFETEVAVPTVQVPRTVVSLPPVKPRVPWVGLVVVAVVLTVVVLLWRAAQPPLAPVRPLPSVDLPVPAVSPPIPQLVDEPQQPVTPPAPAPTPTTERPRRHTRAEVKARWKQLRDRSKDLPADQARALQRHLARVKGCTEAVEVCWEQLTTLEHDYLSAP